MWLGKAFCWLGEQLGGCRYPGSGIAVELAGDDFMPALRKSEFPIYSVGWDEVQRKLAELGLVAIERAEDRPDLDFFYTTQWHWGQIIKSLVYPAEYYAQQERKDCEDYAKKASADAAFYYGLSCLQVRGDTPYEYHAFNMVLVACWEWKLFEPNAGLPAAGELMDMKNHHGWVACRWKS